MVASGIRARPPTRVPVLPTTTMRVLRRSGGPPLIVIDTGPACRARRAGPRDVGRRADAALERLRCALHDRRVEPGARHDQEDALVGRLGRLIVAGIVAGFGGGLGTVGARRPTSIARSSPVSATLVAETTSVGRRSVRASRLPVPAGTRPIATRVPASACATARTVPSPPQAITTSAPRATASAAWPVPGSSAWSAATAAGPSPARRRRR